MRQAKAFGTVVGLVGVLLLAGCASSPGNSEATREIVLQYLGGDGGTAGPYGKQAKKEFGILTPADRTAAEALIDRGAVAFIVFQAGASSATRVVLVQQGRVVADYRAASTNKP
jgi:hypothetical protein